jgi:hypothetical protein
VAAHGTGELVGAIGWAGGPLEGAVRPSASATQEVGLPTSATRAVRPSGGAVRLPKGVVESLVGQAVGPPGGAVRPPALVIGVHALRRVLMGVCIGSILDENS